VAFLTTYYPRYEGDSSGLFISDLVGHLEARGIAVDVVKPGDYNDFGLAYGWGVVRNAKRRPWLVPPMLISMLRALRRSAKEADLVHVHWLLAAPLGLLCGRPWVITLHGTPTAGALEDLTLLRWARWILGPMLRRAQAVICISHVLTDAAALLGANAVWIPNGVTIPDQVGPEADPPEVLYAGRLVEEKGIYELAEATADLNLVVAGDGPLSHVLPQSRGRLPHGELEKLYDRAAVCVLPSHREGQGVVCLEAMAYARPVVATNVGGLAELVVDGETGYLVPPRDADQLRAALLRLLADRELRRRMGDAGRERVREMSGWERVVELTIATYQRGLL
jgi:glycosyltransferase involved in cell wall biosynthesis